MEPSCSFWPHASQHIAHPPAGPPFGAFPHTTGFGIWIQSRGTWTLDEQSNMVWPGGESETSRQGPVLWVFLGLLGLLFLSTVVCGLRRVLAERRRGAYCFGRGPNRRHGHWTPKAGCHDPVTEEEEEEDFFVTLTNRFIL